MSYYRICPSCGASLDPAEICDCEKEEAVLSVGSTQGGKVETSRESTFILSDEQ